MQEKCPVCGKIISASENKCLECGFTELHKTFISKIDVEEWIEKVVKPYKTKYQEEKNKTVTKNDVQNNNKEIQTICLGSGTYIGGVLNGKRHGLGKMTYPSGDKYIGEWKNDKKHGQGKYIYADGTIYDGQWENDRKHGSGEQIGKNGSVYRGEFKNGLRNGMGEETYSDGNKYNGNWIDSKKHGYGEMTYADGTVYKGQWVNDKKLSENNPKKHSILSQNNTPDSFTIGGSVFVLILSLLVIAICSSYDSGFLGGVSIILGIVMAILCISLIISECSK